MAKKSVNVVWDDMQMKDPVFLAGSVHTAKVTIPVSPASLACMAEMYLSLDGGVTMEASSGPVSFTSTGSPQLLSLTITMPNPAVGQSYEAYLVISYGATRLNGYKGSENVIIPVVGQPEFSW
jgi:hypothetical protein